MQEFIIQYLMPELKQSMPISIEIQKWIFEQKGIFIQQLV